MAWGPGLAEASAADLDADWPPAATPVDSMSAVIPLDRRRRGSLAAGLVAARGPGDIGGVPLRVLVVEDDEDEFRFVRDLLTRAEGVTFLLDRAPGAEAGLARLLVGGPYDACLCDHPAGGEGRDGLELARAAHRQGCRTPIILTTGFATPELERDAAEAGVVDLIEKEEFDTQRLDRAVRFAAARQRRLDRIDSLGRVDALTGLADRALFGDRLERALAVARRRRTVVGVMVVDLNGLGPVNDRQGRAAGDRLVQVVGERLKDRLREIDTVAGLGGDGFAVVLADLDRPEHAAVVARKLLDAVAAPVALPDGQGEAAVTANLGAALFPRDGGEAATLLRHADAAMSRARREGGGSGGACRFHDAELDERVRGSAADAAELRGAIERGELRLLYQPQVTLCAAELGLASIVSWRHPRLGPVEPERLRLLAEEGGLIEPLTDWMVEAACRQARLWRDMGLHRLHLAVPLLSRRQLGWAGLAPRLEARLLAEGLTPRWLELEIGERLLLEDLAAGGAGLAPLRELGVRLALTGFGEGAASLTALRDAPLATLKLSRALLQGAPSDRHRAMFAGAVIGLAKQLGLRLVAEGVESGAQLQMLKGQGCDAVQSFLSCPPLPAEACTDWLRQAAARS